MSVVPVTDAAIGPIEDVVELREVVEVEMISLVGGGNSIRAEKLLDVIAGGAVAIITTNIAMTTTTTTIITTIMITFTNNHNNNKTTTSTYNMIVITITYQHDYCHHYLIVLLVQ